jgi:hypothetical protein
MALTKSIFGPIEKDLDLLIWRFVALELTFLLQFIRNLRNKFVNIMSVFIRHFSAARRQC